MMLGSQEKRFKIRMRKNLLWLVSLLGLLLFISACDSDDHSDKDNNNGNINENNNANDDGNNNINNEENNQSEEAASEESDDRIVATTVAITEIMDQLELDLVGIPTSYKDLPERYAQATEVGNPMAPDMELVLSLQPTHVLSVTTLESDLADVFAQHNVPTSFLDLTSIDSMFAEIFTLGEQYGRNEQAEKLINDFTEKMKTIEERIAEQEPPKVLILMGIPGSYIVGTEHSYIGDLVKIAGGENAVTDRDEEYISANTEYLQQLNPDIILRAAHGAPEEVVKMFDQEFTENDIWKHFTAVQNDRVYDLEETLFGTTANLDAIEALEELITILYEN